MSGALIRSTSIFSGAISNLAGAGNFCRLRYSDSDSSLLASCQGEFSGNLFVLREII